MNIKELIERKEELIAKKIGSIKQADGIGASIAGIVGKAAMADPPDDLSVLAVINTTNWMDSHEDVHVKGIWDNSIKNDSNFMHLQEHSMSFDHIISDGEDLSVSVKEYNWKDLGYDFEGKTQALLFDSKVKKSRNEFMHKEYASGRVRNHSVGMQYVDVALAVNDEDYKEEFANWNTHYPGIANKAEADRKGYFFAVKEARIIEGSAVPKGSNTMTPTLQMKTKEKGIDPRSKLVEMYNCKTQILIK